MIKDSMGNVLNRDTVNDLIKRLELPDEMGRHANEMGRHAIAAGLFERGAMELDMAYRLDPRDTREHIENAREIVFMLAEILND